MNAIDTLSAGLNRITRRPWLILIPILLDVAIWMGPRLSVSSLSQQALAALPALEGAGPEYQQSVELARAWLSSAGAQTNLLSMLSMQLMGLPSLSTTLAAKATLFGTAPKVIEVRTWAGLFGVVCALTLLSLVIGSLCLSWLAQEAKEEGLNLGYVLRVALRVWLRLSVLLFAVAAAAAVLITALSLGYALAAVLNQSLATLLFSIVLMAFLWVSAYAGIVLFFALRAMILDNVGLLRAMWSSLNVIHRSFWSTIFFFILINVIQTGLMYVWRRLAVSTPGTLIGILGNAYVSTGIVLASFIFYRDRFVAWQSEKPASTPGEGKP